MRRLSAAAGVAEADRQHGDVTAMAFFSGRLYTGGQRGAVVVYNADLTVYRILPTQFVTVNALCIFNGDLVTTSSDGLLKVWDALTLDAKRTVYGHEDEVRCLLVHQGRLYSGDMNGKVKIWDAGYRPLWTLGCVEEVWSLAVSGGGGGGGGDTVYTARATDVTCTQIAHKAIGTSGETRFVVLASFPGRGPLWVTGNHVVYADQSTFELLVRENHSQHKQVATLPGHSAIVTCLLCVDNRLYSSGYDGVVNVFDAVAFKLTASANVREPVFSLAVGDTGAVYLGMADGRISLLQ